MLRALGPGSVSSVLKIGLDIFHVLVWIGTIVLGLTFLAVLIGQPFLFAGSEVATGFTDGLADGLTDEESISINGRTLTAAQVVQLIRSPAIPIGLLVLAGYLAGVAAILGRLRRVFQTLSRGDPFHPENARRFRQIGLVLMGLELINQIAPDVVFAMLPDGVGPRRYGVNLDLTSWFAVAVVFVLAEVFREGARLRREAELTI